jgi:Astacin (Peptidase family M12A)
LALKLLAEEHAAQIDKAIHMIHEATCLRFIPWTDEEDYVTFTGKATHCSSLVGREGGEQLIQLVNDTVGVECFRIGSVLHEMMHAIGFHHMHKTPERDDFIKIIYENVDENYIEKLAKFDDEDLTDFGLPYDIDSVLHYSSKLYSKNNEDTLVAINPDDTHRLGQRERLSDGDILRIRRMYNCKGQDAVDRRNFETSSTVGQYFYSSTDENGHTSDATTSTNEQK